MSEYQITQIVEVLSQIEGDTSVPKNIRTRIGNAIIALNEKETTIAVKIDRSLQELDSLDEDPNIPAYTRTQIWNVVSLLECIG